MLGVFFFIHTCSLTWWHLQSDAFALQLVWCNGFLHLLHVGSLQLAWLPQLEQYKITYSYYDNQLGIERVVLIIDFLTYLIRTYYNITYKNTRKFFVTQKQLSCLSIVILIHHSLYGVLENVTKKNPNQILVTIELKKEPKDTIHSISIFFEFVNFGGTNKKIIVNFLISSVH